MGCEFYFCRSRHLFAVADGDRRMDSERLGGVGFKTAAIQGSGQEQRVPPHRASRQVAAALAQSRAAQRFSAHRFPAYPGRVHPARIHRHVRFGAGRICASDDRLHLLRPGRRHSAQPHCAFRRGRVPAEPDAQHALQHCAAGGADCGAGHLRRDEPQQRDCRHQGHGDQPVPADHSDCDHGRGAGGGAVSVRPILSAPGQPQAGGAAQPDQGPAHANLPASRAEMDVRTEATARRARTYFLLRILRSRPQRVCQPLRIRVRPRDLPTNPAHLCQAGSLESRLCRMGF